MKMVFCPDCTLPMDTIVSSGKEYTVCGNKPCRSYVDLFGRDEEAIYDAMDMEQEMRKGMDDDSTENTE